MRVSETYQAFAITKAADYGDPFFQAKLWVLALGGELGEISNMAKKWLGHSHPADPAKLHDEVGDCFWYVACLCELMELDFASFITSPVTLPRLTGDRNHDTLALCLSLQSAQGVMASVALYAADIDSMSNMLVSSLQRVTVLLVRLLTTYGFTVETVLAANVSKLNVRYPAGFSAERSINRVN